MIRATPIAKRDKGIASTDATNELVDDANDVRAMLLGSGSGKKKTPLPGATCQIVAPISGQIGRYTAKQFSGVPNQNSTGNLVLSDYGVLPGAPDCEVWYSADINGTVPLLRNGDIVEGRPVWNKSTGMLIVEVWDRAPVGATFRVDLVETEGAPGTQTTQSTWKYTVIDLYGRTLGTAMSPERVRTVGALGAALMGTGYYRLDGGFVLAEAWEGVPTGHC